MRTAALICSLFWLLAHTASARPVGFSMLQVADGADPPVAVGLWYPATGVPRPTQIGLFVQDLVPDAQPAGQGLPLVVISHGTSGSWTSHADTAWALAAAGFVVAAPTHTGDNYRDQSRVLDVAGRTRQIEHVIDHLLASWRPQVVAANRIGAFGFSAGGLTVLIAAGGRPDFDRIGPHCAALPALFDCRLIADDAHSPAASDIGGLVHDPRLRAIAVAAPAMGFTFDRAGLASVRLPVQLWEAEDDAILPPALYTEIVREALPQPPEFHPVAHAGHFDFLAPCPARLASIAPAICTSARGFDRTQFHQTLNAGLIAFFSRTLAVR